jgi:hypothetical protein
MSASPLGSAQDVCFVPTAAVPADRWLNRAGTHLSCFSRADWVLLCSLSLLVFPAFKLAHLPLRFNLIDMATAYWFGTAASGAFVAIVFAVIGLPPRQTLFPFISRVKEKKSFLVIAIVLASVMLTLLGLWLGLMVTVIALAVGELLERTRGSLKSKLLDVLMPAAYLFVGITLVFAVNHAIAGIRNPEAYDGMLARADQILFHINVSSLAHWSLNHLPMAIFRALEFTYYGLYSRIAGALILLAILKGRREAIAMVRTILICYVMALLIYACIPAKGPYAGCAIHASTYPHSLRTYATQEILTQRVRMLWAHSPRGNGLPVDVFDYFISFPSLHVALPLIAIWFLRGYKWIAGVYLAIYVLLLIPALVFLEWHYVVDIWGGCLVALLAIWVSQRVSPPVLAEAPALAL